MRLCVIGNSHVAALRAANGEGSMLGPHDIDFYAVPGGRQPRLLTEGGRLRSKENDRPIVTTVPGAEQDGLRFADYDALIISASGFFAARNHHVEPDLTLHPCGTVASAEWASLDAAPLLAIPRVVSAAVFDAVVQTYVREHASVVLVATLGQAFAGPVIVQPWPAPDRVLKNDQGWFPNAWYGTRGRLMWHRFFAVQRETVAKVTRSLGPRGIFLDYPLPEVQEDGFMDGRWCMPDPWHANPAYGALVLAQILDSLTDRATPRGDA